jgi:hypothetical protein
MSQYALANNVSTTIASSVTSTATTITLASNANFPTIPAGYVWAVTLNDAATKTVFEIVYVTSTSGANLQGCLRGQEGTTAQAWLANDKAFAADTAGILGSFVTTTQAAGFVQLNPSIQQSGSINVSGNIVASGSGNILSNVAIGGNLTVTSVGVFGSYIQPVAVYPTLPYAATPISSLPLAFHASGGGAYIGPSSALAVRGITASLLAIASSTGNFFALDTSGNIATLGSFLGQNGLFNGEVAGTTVFQGSNQVVDTITSTTLSVTKTVGTYDIELPSALMIGGRFANLGNGGTPTITLPNYGSWFIEVFYGVQEVTNTNMTITLALTGGTITNQWLTNANGHTAFNAESIILVYGRGYTTINNQSLTFTLTATGGTLDPINQPWTVWATRYN